MRTLNVTQHNIIINGRAAPVNDYGLQRRRAVYFYTSCDIDIRFSLPLPFYLGTKNNRSFLSPYDWEKIKGLCSDSKKGIDLFIAPSLEPFSGVPASGLTILPESRHPEGGWGRIPPQVNRPAIYLNASLGTPEITLTHELGHALLNTLNHNPVSGNFMFDQPGNKIVASQIARLVNSPFLV